MIKVKIYKISFHWPQNFNFSCQRAKNMEWNQSDFQVISKYGLKSGLYFVGS